MKVRGDFLGPPRSTDKTTLIINVSNGAKTMDMILGKCKFPNSFLSYFQ